MKEYPNGYTYYSFRDGMAMRVQVAYILIELHEIPEQELSVIKDLLNTKDTDNLIIAEAIADEFPFKKRYSELRKFRDEYNSNVSEEPNRSH